MHVPDGFLDLSTSVATAGVSAAAVATALRRSRTELDVVGPAVPGLVSAFVFAVQMVNFPVGAGTSGHLMGGALAAALVGPATAVVCLTVVLVVQALLFADGGLTALGTNVLLIAVVTVLVGHVVTRGALRVLPRRPGSVAVAAALGGLVSVPAAALVFVGLYAVGGAVPVDLGTLATAMLGWHVLIGVGEALITGAVVSAVVASRPDLVRSLRGTRRDLVVVDADGRRTTVPATVDEPAAPARAGLGRPLAVALAACAVVAGGVSLLASGHPDGLEHVAGVVGFGDAARDSAVAASPLADYAVAGVGSPVAVTVAGLVGVAVTALLAAGAVRAVGRRRVGA